MSKVAVIGAGPSGLCAIKHCLEENFEVTAFEQNDDIGGQWYSTAAVGKNKFGVEAHSSIYENLVTNLPKELMAFPDYPYDESIVESFLTPEKVLNYFHSYTDAFKLRTHIKFEHHVMRVRPLPNTETWEVIVKDLPSGEIKTFHFDFVFICTGISTPSIPKLEGQKSFKGQVLHSHDYRNTKMFEHEKVLLVGTGASSADIVLQVGDVAEKVYWVHKMNEKYGRNYVTQISDNVVEKPAISKITPSGAEFVDGTSESFSIIIFATGFSYSFPFLSVDSGISVDNKKVYPLYKHLINIIKPSLAIIGLPLSDVGMPMYFLQIKFCLQFWSGRKKFPSKIEMMEDTEKDLEQKRSNDKYPHYLGLTFQPMYLAELATVAEIEPLKPVIIKMFHDVLEKAFKSYHSFRNYRYKIINDEEFECSYNDDV